MSNPINLAILISGGGTTMDSTLAACFEGELKRKVFPRLIISSRPDAGGMQKAIARGMDPSDVICIQRKASGLSFGWKIIDACESRGVDHIAQMGWIPFTPDSVTERFAGHITNQHPGPVRGTRLGFGGKGMQGRAVHAAVLWFARNCGRDFPFTEATAHRAVSGVDEGAVLKIERVPILPDDDIQSLQERALDAEHRVQIATLLDFAGGTVQELSLEDIVLPSEKALLAQAINIGSTLYPHG